MNCPDDGQTSLRAGLSQVTGRRISSPPLPLMCQIDVRHLEISTTQDISGIDVTASAPLRSSHFPFPLSDQSSQYYSVLQRTTLTWPSGQPSNSATRLKPAFSYILGA